MPVDQDIHKAYRYYYTHLSEVEGTDHPVSNDIRATLSERLRPLWRFFKFVERGFYAAAYGYSEGTSDLQHLAGYSVFLCPLLSQRLGKRLCYIRAVRGGRLLDVGFGRGNVLCRMRSLGWDVTGVEPDPACIELAQRRDLSVYAGRIEDIAFEDDEFDAINMKHVLEHAHDPLRLLRECRRILRPNGVLRIIVPNANSLGHQHLATHWRGLEPPRHLWVFTPRALKGLLRRAGFDVDVSTSSVTASRVYRKSLAIAVSDGAEVGNTSTPVLHLRATAFAMYEHLRVLLGEQVGEEIVLEGRYGQGAVHVDRRA